MNKKETLELLDKLIKETKEMSEEEFWERDDSSYQKRMREIDPEMFRQMYYGDWSEGEEFV